jgi:effector-binding domain-containing protein
MYRLVETKKLKVAFISGKGKIPDFNKAVDRLYSFFYKTGQEKFIDGCLIGLFYSKYGGRYSACLPVKEGVKVGGDIRIRVLPSQKAVLAVHKGGYKTIDESFDKIFKFIKKRGFRWKFPVCEEYIEAEGKESDYITNIYVPIAKI